jgi:16S rRNA processing protein RimM
LLAGEAGKPHGLAGEIYVVPISDDPRRFEPGSALIRADGSTVVVESARMHRNRLLVKFEGIDDRDAAEVLRGDLYVSKDSLRALGEDEYWDHDLVGAEIVTATGDHVGKVDAVRHGGAQDLLVASSPRGEVLIPMVKEIVTRVDAERGVITVDPPEGLLP